MVVHFIPFDPRPDNFQPCDFLSKHKVGGRLILEDNYGSCAIRDEQLAVVSGAYVLFALGMFGHPSTN